MQRYGNGQHAFFRNRGQGLFVLLALLFFVGAGLIFSLARPAPPNIKKDEQTTAALAQAKDALIGYAASDANRPGELPCPDVNNDGQLTLGIDFTGGAGSPCVSLLGRLPWKTLGLPDLRDGSGERLWYALSNIFRAGATSQIDDDTKGNITVYSESSSTVMTLEAVAVIFAPGAVLGAQDRSCTVGVNCTTTEQCTTSPASLTPKCNPTNYLDTTGGGNNATTNGPYISAQPSNTFNDRLLVITTNSLMTPVEQRVAREMLTLLKSYKAASLGWGCNCYPWAANNFDDDSVTGKTRGMVPIEDALPHTWASLGITVPPWMIGSNIWGKKFYYAVAPIDTATHTAGTLTVDGVAGKRLVLITPGPAGASRPSSNLPDYLDDAENSNNDNIFQTPSSTAYARDRIYTIP